MERTILISVKKEWIKKILSGEKTVEIRTKFPKDYTGPVYLYCTKERKAQDNDKYNGKIVGIVNCNKVETINRCYDSTGFWYETFSLDKNELCKRSCLDVFQLGEYVIKKAGYAIHISSVNAFDDPKDLSEFKMERAPQSWCYVYKD